ncbi:MAG: N-acetylmuramoyl-L-alanine amidase [Oscillospiraceae bacterium]|nr:N-acetylmuramoyl-L-alanine amidase [Oscillospiraceae bacterium]
MIGRRNIIAFIAVYALVLSCFILVGIGAGKSADAFSNRQNESVPHTVVIDAGHGYPDGGTSSCDGTLECDINLEISLRLDDLMHLLGIPTVMTRNSKESVYSQGDTIAAKKISDLKNRVNLINSIQNPVVISIHQNYFQEGKYRGAQIFYNDNNNSKDLAVGLQDAFIRFLNPGSNRRPKRGEDIYLLKNIKCTAVLVECGFLSNLQESMLLQNKEYQKKICGIIAVTVGQYITEPV